MIQIFSVIRNQNLFQLENGEAFFTKVCTQEEAKVINEIAGLNLFDQWKIFISINICLTLFYQVFRFFHEVI